MTIPVTQEAGIQHKSRRVWGQGLHGPHPFIPGSVAEQHRYNQKHQRKMPPGNPATDPMDTRIDQQNQHAEYRACREQNGSLIQSDLAPENLF